MNASVLDSLNSKGSSTQRGHVDPLGLPDVEVGGARPRAGEVVGPPLLQAGLEKFHWTGHLDLNRRNFKPSMDLNEFEN